MFQRKIIVGIIGTLCLLGSPHANAATVTFRDGHQLFALDSAKYANWKGTQDQWSWNGQPVDPLPEWRVDGDQIPPLPAGVAKTSAIAWNRAAMQNTINAVVGAGFNRDAGTVTIRRDEKGNIVFDGVGLTGRTVDSAVAANLLITALEKGISDVMIPYTESQPQITVEDPELQKQGIKEVVTVGESEFGGSPVNRRRNIKVGLAKFNGHLIAQGETFSFTKILGPVDGTTGYVKELVIKGDRTEPDYGGGLCQISSTAYRGIWEYGFPIVKRRNHSYAVHYYSPAGTDATVYPGAADMSFINDSPGALLIQTYQQNDHAYFIYYGTRDSRRAGVYGPFVLSHTPAPPDKEEFTTDLPPGQRKKLNERVPGLKAVWYRTLARTDGTQKTEEFFSNYEARPLFYAVGVDPSSLSETDKESMQDEGMTDGNGASSSSSAPVARPISLPKKPLSRR